MLHVLKDRLLPDGLLDAPLRLHIERIGVHSLDGRLRLDMARPRLAEELREAGGIVLRGMRDLRLRLR